LLFIGKSSFWGCNALYNATYRLYIGMTGKELLKVFLANGWTFDRIHGSHHIMVKEGLRAVPIPIHGNQDLPKGLVSAILKQGRLKKKS
jgi:predicted RNA binding protein YcfA (HicA-like mRNA interferase family)